MHLNVITTWKCNFQCKHCIFECPHGEELSFETYKKAVEKLLPFDLKGVTFTGGEAILHPKLFDMAALAVKHNLKFGIVSNAWIYEQYLPIVQTFKNNFSGFNFSLDGLEGKHDYIRKKGSFKKVVEALYYYKMIGVEVVINFVLNDYNYDEFEEVIAYCSKIGVKKIKLAGILPTKVNGKFLLSFEKRIVAYNKVETFRKKYNIKIDVANSLYNSIKLDFCPVITNIIFTLNQTGELIYCCDIPGSYSKVGLPVDDMVKVIENRMKISDKIRKDRMKKIVSEKLKKEDQSCYYCHKFFNLIKR
jgi:MoaA/NifB/PqqE/SkfB family radical SAM enzyme